MGVSYSRLRCFQKALQCFQLAVKPASQQPPLLATVLHNLGAALNAAGHFRAAVDAHRLAARLYGWSAPHLNMIEELYSLHGHAGYAKNTKTTFAVKTEVMQEQAGTWLAN